MAVDPMLSELVELVSNPPHLTSEQIENIYEQINQGQCDLKSRAKFMGFLQINTHDDRWQEQFLWLVENLPEHPLLGKIGTQMVDGLNPAFFEAVKTAWERKIRQSPASTAVLTNAAKSLMVYELKNAAEYIRLAEKLEPTNPEVNRISRHITHMLACGLGDEWE